MEPVWLQETHSPAQATLQQTPSAQNPDEHSSPLVHGPRPLGSLPQLLPTQGRPALQSLLVMHFARHLLPPQVYGKQDSVGPGRQRPSPSQMLIPDIPSPSHTPA